MLLAASFALLALMLTSVGVYGVLAYTIAQRRHEHQTDGPLRAEQ